MGNSSRLGAHTSEAAAGAFGWSFEPLVIVPLAVVAVLYIAGSGQLSWRGKADRRREQVWFWLGFASPAFALCSPLHALGTRIFCSPHGRARDPDGHLCSPAGLVAAGRGYALGPASAPARSSGVHAAVVCHEAGMGRSV
jgi:hypothetical protein